MMSPISNIIVRPSSVGTPGAYTLLPLAASFNTVSSFDPTAVYSVGAFSGASLENDGLGGEHDETRCFVLFAQPHLGQPAVDPVRRDHALL